MRVCVIGAGGHGRVIADIVNRSRTMAFVGFLDDYVDGIVNGSYVLGKLSNMMDLAAQPEDIYFVIGIGDNKIRKQFASQLRAYKFATVIDPSAVISPSVVIRQGTVIMPNVVVNANSLIGEHVILNTGCTVDHDNMIEDFVHVSPGVHLAGTVAIHEGTHIGTGTSIIPGCTVGSWSVIGAGSAVVENIQSYTVAYGVPATPKRMTGHTT